MVSDPNQQTQAQQGVLILVLMEYGLGPVITLIRKRALSLNPCFNGIWSRTPKVISFAIDNNLS